MLKSLSEIKKNVHFKSSISIDNSIFKLHYRVTTISLFVATILVCSREYVGEHIQCISDKAIPENVLKTFCFFTSTYTIPKHFNKTVGDDVPHPGIGPQEDEDEVTHHAYYQWVPFVLFLQALMFYAPHYIWRKLEDGRVKNYVAGLEYIVLSTLEKDFKFKKNPADKEDTVVPSKENRDQKLKGITKVYIERLHMYKDWSVHMIACEILNFINVVGNIYFTNVFLGGVFLEYGPSVVNFLEQNPEDRSDPMDVAFPKVTKCLFRKFGASGTIQKHDALCIMALNIINEKIYIFMWFWFVILAIITGLGLLWRFVTLILLSFSQRYKRLALRNLCPSHIDPSDTQTIEERCDATDLLFLTYVGKNMDGMVTRKFLKTLNRELRGEIEERDYLLKKKLDIDDEI